MAKKNQMAYLLLGGAGLVLLASANKGKTTSKSATGGNRPAPPPPPPNRGGGSGGSTVSLADYLDQLEFLGYPPDSGSVLDFQKDYNAYLQSTGATGPGISEDGKFGNETAASLEAIIYGLGFNAQSWAQALSGSSSVAQGTLTVRTDDDVQTLNYVKHNHLGIGPRDPRAPKRSASSFTHSLFKDGLTAQDVMLLVQRAASGTLREGGSGSTGREVGVLYTGPMNVVSSGGPKNMINHYHTSRVYVRDIEELAKEGRLVLSSSIGQELPPEDGTESHFHDIILTIS